MARQSIAFNFLFMKKEIIEWKEVERVKGDFENYKFYSQTIQTIH